MDVSTLNNNSRYGPQQQDKTARGLGELGVEQTGGHACMHACQIEHHTGEILAFRAWLPDIVQTLHCERLSRGDRTKSR
eukprot:1158793-Pelagomonas_calceolata.AAC.2